MNPTNSITGIPPHQRQPTTAQAAGDNVAVEEIRRGRINPRLVCLLQPQSAGAENYSRLRLALEHMHQPGRGLVVGVTSPGEGDGKTLTAINLAGALAQDARARVLLVDLNLRGRGTYIRNYLDLKTLAGPGIVDWIGNADITENQVTRFLPGFNLYLMPSGGRAELPYELLNSTRLDELFAQVRRQYDFVILDTPQILRLPDTELIARVVDGYLIVVKANFTPRSRLEESLNLMVQDKVIGLVFNAVTDGL